MQCVILDHNWMFSENPFPAYRCYLLFGRNKKDFSFLPVKDVQPIEDDKKCLVLPKNRFKIIRTKEKGTILVVPGQDKSDRCLGFVGVSDGFRGDSGMIENHTTATVLKKCSAQNNCHGHTSICAIFNIGQKVAMYSVGRRTNEVIFFEWTGKDLIETHMTRDEFFACSCQDEESIEL